MNSIVIAGNISQDAEIRYLPNGDAVTSFSVADNMIGKDKGAIFWRCSFFGPRGAAVANFLTKGQAVTVAGSISERDWTDKEGQQRKSMDLRVNDVALQGGKRDAAPAPRPATQPQRQAAPATSAGFDGADSDIPW